MFEFSYEVLLLLVLAAFVAGFVDSIAGGGGLLTVPALMLAGLSPVEALGTTKLQGLFGLSASTVSYAAKGHVDPMRQLPAAAMSFAGSIAGALLATLLPGEALRAVLPPLLVAIALYFAFKPRLDDIDRAERLRPFLFSLTIVPLIGFYDGVFGPGAGSFYMLAFVGLGGYGVLKATAHTKFLNLASNLGAFLLFAAVGAVAWKVGLLMGAAAFLGARIGSGLAMRIGARLIKPVLVISCVALAARLLAEPGHPIRAAIGW